MPPPPPSEIPRTNLVYDLYSRLCEGQQSILVEGADGSGKTTLLAQFVRTYPTRCISFFVRGDYWGSHPETFLREITDQISVLLGRDPPCSSSVLTLAELKNLFAALYHELRRAARLQQECFFFVIDGLDLVPERRESESICDLIPRDPQPGIKLLLSSSNRALHAEFGNCLAYPIPNFSPPEAEAYLRCFCPEYLTLI